MRRLRPILYAEDSIHDVELTLAALSDLRIANEIVLAHDGADALDYLYMRGRFAGRDPGMPAVALLDIKMPRVDGLEVLRGIRSDPALARLPVVLLTSSREERDLVSGYELGANAYVVKPVAFDEFTIAVKQLGLFWAVINEPPPADARTAA